MAMTQNELTLTVRGLTEVNANLEKISTRMQDRDTEYYTGSTEWLYHIADIGKPLSPARKPAPISKKKSKKKAS